MILGLVCCIDAVVSSRSTPVQITAALPQATRSRQCTLLNHVRLPMCGMAPLLTLDLNLFISSKSDASQDSKPYRSTPSISRRSAQLLLRTTTPLCEPSRLSRCTHEVQYGDNPSAPRPANDSSAFCSTISLVGTFSRQRSCTVVRCDDPFGVTGG